MGSLRELKLTDKKPVNLKRAITLLMLDMDDHLIQFGLSELM